ncbi:hypothetical protein BDV98DRAFT_607438 [Pterulicium gracile]|uniref:Uncharacterized protein n=1 Tax=Pterulicium gracile TaxID=1884261 RepID=A0A5C3Q850_9AGAR|nr:hypothetical protein BDV98DRAFT_607438 [Pterula gracilis]
MSNVESSEEAVLELIALIRDTPLASLDDVDLDALRAALPGPPLKATEGDNKKATLAGASPLLFAEDVSEQQKTDVEITVLFAQLATAAKFIKSENQWGSYDAYRFYVRTLNSIGWRLSLDSYEQLDNSRVTGSLDNLLLSLLQTSDPSFKTLFSKVIDHIKESALAGKIFGLLATSGSRAMFQTGTVAINSDRVLMDFGAYGFEAKEHIDRILFWNFTRQSAKFYQGYTQASLIPSIMDRIRKPLIDKLGYRIEKYIYQVPLLD